MKHQIQKVVLVLSLLVLPMLVRSQADVYNLSTKEWWFALQIDTQNRYRLDVVHQWIGEFSQWDCGHVTKKNDTLVLVSEMASSWGSLIEMKILAVHNKANEFFFETEDDEFFFETDDAYFKILEIKNPQYRDQLLVQKKAIEEPYRFERFIDENLRGVIQTEWDQDSIKFETTYLGALAIKDRKLLVISQYYSGKALPGSYSRSRMIFLEESGEALRVCDVNDRKHLPTEIENNRLKLGELYFDGFDNYLPKLICIPGTDRCYD